MNASHPLFKKFLSLAGRLSPENLYCDGECTQAEAKVRYNRIMKEWRDLEKEAGFTVTVDEVENAWIANARLGR
jgi:hypothetical protein